ncbi:MAG: holo-ACP synthase [Kiritimatiellia bacterium]|nr:holo-ACP synthase [Kiritimatiellia bacterium]
MSIDGIGAGESVLGIGVDLVETGRLRRALSTWGPRMLQRLFRNSERAYCESRATPWRHYAGRFAVKEAVAKAFGTGIGGRIGWLDIEVRRDGRTGAPSVTLFGAGLNLAEERGVRRVLVSLSHTHAHAIAQALLLGRSPGETSI